MFLRTLGISLCCIAPLFGTTVYDTDIDMQLTGFRTAASGDITTHGDYSGLRLDWTISFDTTSQLWRYQFGFSGFTSPAISHFIIDLSDVCLDTKDCIQNEDETSYGTYSSSGPGQSNPYLTGQIVGYKFDFGGEGPFSYEFLSTRSPVWGDFYIKGGNATSTRTAGGAAYNRGMSDHSIMDIQAFVARPDTVTGSTVPEPATLGMLGVGLIIVGGLGRRKKA